MRPDQITSLTGIEEKLVDLFTQECKPDAWKAARSPDQMRTALAEKKVASATLTTVFKLQNVLRNVRGAGVESEGDEPRTAATADDDDGLIAREAASLRKQGLALLNGGKSKKG